MKRLLVAATTLLLAACSSMPSWVPGSGWTTLIDGDKGLENFQRVGDANWRAEGGAIVADMAATGGYLLTKSLYKDFQIKAEFWADDDANSGIFIRCDQSAKIDAKICYEVNIFDKRPDPTYGTGAIVDIAKVDPMPKAGGKWNTFEITAKGPHLVVIFNGQKTVDVQDSKHASGPLALQYGSGVMKWRKVQIKEL